MADRIKRTAAPRPAKIASPIEKMADIEFDDRVEFGDLFRGDEIEAVAGMDFEARIPGLGGGARNAVEFRAGGRGVARSERFAPGAGVNLDHRRADRAGGIDLLRLGGDKERDPDAGAGQLADRAAQCLALAGGVETAFGGALGPPLGNDTGGMRAQLAGNADHLRRRRHFKIERLFDARFQPHDIVIDDMAAVLAQMCGDAVGAGRNRDLGGLHRIGMTPAARVAHGGDVVDVDAEADRRSGHADCLCAALTRSRARHERPLSSPAIAR